MTGLKYKYFICKGTELSLGYVPLLKSLLTLQPSALQVETSHTGSLTKPASCDVPFDFITCFYLVCLESFDFGCTYELRVSDAERQQYLCYLNDKLSENTTVLL